MPIVILEKIEYTIITLGRQSNLKGELVDVWCKGVKRMLAKQVNITARSARPLPISYIIRMAQQFSCDVYIQDMGVRINAKDYNEMKRDWNPQGNRLVFYLNGADEVAAGDKLKKALEN